jgi:hypothetical protein
VPSEDPADSSLLIANTVHFADHCLSGRDLQEDRAAILLQPSLRWRGILKPYSVPLGVIQDMCLVDIYKGRGSSLTFALGGSLNVTSTTFSEVLVRQIPLRSILAA